MDNPSFFPQGKSVGDASMTEGGASLRDWFAGQALVAMGRPVYSDNRSMIHRERARHAYEMADAMLAERAKGQANG